MMRPIPFTEISKPNYADMSDILQFEDLQIIGSEFDKENNTIIFYCEPRFEIGVCPECGELCDKVHDRSRERRVHDAPIRGCNVLLVFKSTRLKCGRCEHIFTLPIRDIVLNCTYTYRLAEEIANPKRKQDVATLARIYGLGYKTVESILKKAAEAKLNRRKDNPIRVVRVGIDEISNKKGHGNYVLVLTDLDRRILLDILPDRTKKRLKEWLKNPPQGIILKGSLKVAACDLWSHYKDAVLEVFSNVYVVADRFHVMKNMNETINEERRKAQSEAKTKEEKKKLKGLRYILLKNKSKLNEKERKSKNKNKFF